MFTKSSQKLSKKVKIRLSRKLLSTRAQTIWAQITRAQFGEFVFKFLGILYVHVVSRLFLENYLIFITEHRQKIVGFKLIE